MMGRPERPLDADAGPMQRFAAELRRLRDDAGKPGYRRMSRVAHFSVTTLSEAAGGERFPSLPVTLAYVRACGGELAAWEARWRATAAEISAGSAAEVTDGNGGCPYVGLAAFQQADADRFFGRDRVVAELAERVAEHRFVGVFGASGSGKSSVLRAGLAAQAMADGLSGDGGGQPTVVF